MYDITDITLDLKNILTVRAVAIFINPKVLDDKQIEVLNKTFKDFNNSTMLVMTEIADKEFDFEYHTCILSEGRSSTFALIQKTLSRRVLPHNIFENREIKRKHLNKVVVFEEEVYGTNENNAEFVMIHAVYLENGEEKDRFKRYINPIRKIKSDFEEITGIQQDIVLEGEKLSVVIKDFNEWHKDALWCCTIDEFVYPILERAFWMSDIKLDRDVFDLKHLIANKMPNIIKNRIRLDLAKKFDWEEDKDDVELSVIAFKKIYWEYCD